MRRELIRRLFLLGGILQAIWLFLYIPSPVLDVRMVDFAKKHTELTGLRFSSQSLLADKAPQSLEGYIQSQTDGRLIDVTGAEWDEFFNILPPSGRSQYFRLIDKPLVQLRDRFSSSGTFKYLRLQEGATARYLSVNSRPAGEAVSFGAPSRIAYPFRSSAWMFAAGGVAFYILIPRLKKLPDAIRFGRASAVVVPDILGVVMTGLFFSLPLLIAPSFSHVSTPEIFTESWGFVVFFWPFCIGGLFVLWYAAHYASFQIVLTDQAIRWMTHGHDEVIAWDQIASIAPVDQRMPRWLRILAILAIFIKPRAALQVSQLHRYHRQGVIITRRDGWKLKLWQDMPGYERIAEALAAAGQNVAVPAREE